MNRYKTMARTLDGVHGLITAVWIVGFPVRILGFLLSFKIPPVIWWGHTIIVIGVLTVDLLYGWECPLTTMAGRFYQLAEPGITHAKYEYINNLLARMRIRLPKPFVNGLEVAGTMYVVFALLWYFSDIYY